MKKVISFTDLFVWQKGHRLVLLIYQTTKKFPKEERYGLIDQMRRCAISITSNIAEGFGRYSKKEKVQFLSISLGSVKELQNQLLVARDIDCISQSEFTTIANLTIEVHKLLHSLTNKFKK